MDWRGKSLYLHKLNGLLERSLLAGDDGDMGTLLRQLDSHSPSKTDTSSRQVDMLSWPSFKEESKKKKPIQHRICKRMKKMVLVHWSTFVF